ncbi:MAG: substrate-binding domain-containing protein [Clostridiales bacterium]|jgi:ABC-type tungstate transport system permease subunit|nr:substrate-binding domain-containing protein [Clostridiales bacterium]
MRKKLFAASAAIVLLVAVFAFAACNGKDQGNDRIDLIPKLELLYETDKDMLNTYSLIAVNPNATFKTEAGVTVTSAPKINSEGADAFILWMTSEEGLNAVKDFGKADYGEALFYVEEDFSPSVAAIPQATEATKDITLSTTTSVNDSGLLEGYLKPLFENKYGYNLRILSQGTGAAITTARQGDADLLLVHSKAQEEGFIGDANNYARKVEGFESERIHFMYNYFVLIGPKADPAGVREAASVKEAFDKIATGKFVFVSRGDNSGTHSAEIKLWDIVELKFFKDNIATTTEYPNKEATKGWYVSAGLGMGNCLIMANTLNGYVLSDKATYLAYKNSVQK